jgi:hypothetical protein
MMIENAKITRKFEIHAHGWWSDTVIIEVEEDSNWNYLDYDSREEELVKAYWPNLNTTDGDISEVKIKEILDDAGVEWV